MTMVRGKHVCGIVVVALIIRVIAFCILPEPHMPYNAIFAYIKGAQIIIEGQGFSDPSFPVYTPPLYSISIALVTVLFGDGVFAIKVIQMVVDSFTAALVYLIIQEVFDGRTGTWAGSMWALYPFAIYSTLYIGTEAIFAFFLALYVVLVVHGIKTDRWYWFCISGVVLGMCTLIKGTSQYIPLILPLVLFTLRSQSAHWLRNSALSVICFIVIILPWGIRNYVVLHEVIPVGANSSIILYGSSEQLLTLGTRQQELDRLFEKARMKGMVQPSDILRPAERQSFLATVAIETYREALKSDPFGLAAFMIRKFWRLWYSTESGNNHGIIFAVNAPIYLLAIIGLMTAQIRKNGMALMLLGLVTYFVIIHWLTLPLFRYMLPVMPYVIAFAAFGLLFVIERRWPEVPERFALRSIPLSSRKHTHQG